MTATLESPRAGFAGRADGTVTARSSWRIAGSAAELEALFLDDVNVVLWRRAAPLEDPRRLAAAMLAAAGYAMSCRVDGATLHGLPLLPLRDGSLRDALTTDLAETVELFATLTGAPVVGLRLASLASAMCPRFHVDRVALRLVCTGFGPGTEWVDDRHVERRWLGGRCPAERDPATGMLREGARIECAGVLDVVLMKGELWPGNAGRGAVHRSPPVPAATRRLVLTLDALER